MRNQYRNLSSRSSLDDLILWAQTATRHRQFDLDDYNNQVSANPFIYSAPASSSDMVGTEKVGDIAVDNGFLYVVVDNAGALEWRRTAISTF